MSNPAQLSIWNLLLSSIADEMGIALWRTGHSPNIRERKDFSCALFDIEGGLVAQAAHIPVHLGAMPEAIKVISRLAPWDEGDIVILNDPYLGGTHLPDITLVSPVFSKGTMLGFVANRAHHADIGGMSAGSMPVASELYQEGLIIPPLRLYKKGVRNQEVLELLLRNVRTPNERIGDLEAQIGALAIGAKRLQDLVTKHDSTKVAFWMSELKNYAERLTRSAISEIPDGIYEAVDHMEGKENVLLPICVKTTVKGDTITFDFTGTAKQQEASINAVAAVTRSAVLYCIRCLLPQDTPSNEGVSRPIETIIPEESLVNATAQHAVSAGNVETSQRITDVILRSLSIALPNIIPASSAGTMSNFTFGSASGKQPFAYYETIPGGSGGGPNSPGENGIQTHMTNTLNTPTEAIETEFPVRVRNFSVRSSSGGLGEQQGGNGLVREIEFLTNMVASIVGDRRKKGALGLRGGSDGIPAQNTYIDPDGEETKLEGSVQLSVQKGDRLRIETPGGGGWGKKGEID